MLFLMPSCTLFSLTVSAFVLSTHFLCGQQSLVFSCCRDLLGDLTPYDLYLHCLAFTQSIVIPDYRQTCASLTYYYIISHHDDRVIDAELRRGRGRGPYGCRTCPTAPVILPEGTLIIIHHVLSLLYTMYKVPIDNTGLVLGLAAQTDR
jgi:hypothetical protein